MIKLMADLYQELEVKFHVSGLPAVEARLQSLGAKLIQARIHETNLRFDTPEGNLTRTYRVLRLRQDSAARLTYKGPSQSQDGARLRQEIEFTVGDFEAAQAFLEALGYQISLMYEKYRTSYDLENVHVVLDELPYGDFIEIEGPDSESIRQVSQRLGLDWEARVPESYTVLFDRLRPLMGLAFRDLSFADFQGLEISLSSLNIRPADE